jgi:hypothetical protein
LKQKSSSRNFDPAFDLIFKLRGDDIARVGERQAQKFPRKMTLLAQIPCKNNALLTIM